MNNARTIKVGVLGAGNFANKQHLPNLKQIEGVGLVAICDIDAEAARRTATEFGIARTYTDGHEMIQKECMDALWSIVPAFARTDIEATAASRGIHIFSEKPQAIEMQVAKRIDNAVRQAGVLSTVCFRERYRPIFQEARRLLADKEVVHIRFQSIGGLPSPPGEGERWSDAMETGGCRFFDWGPHAVDYSRFMSGLDIVTAQAFFKLPEKYNKPVSACFNFALSNGATMAMTFLDASPCQPPGEAYFLIYYEGGYVGVHNYSHIDMNGERVFEGGDYNPWFELDRRFCEAVRTGDDSELLNDYHDGLYSLAPVLAGWESARRGGQPIDIAEFMQFPDRYASQR